MSFILLGITGSIAAYKAADIASQLTKLGHHVTCICTRSALEFVTPLTLQTLSRQPVISDLFAEKDGWQPGHIQLADRADLLLIAPASANILASMAHGFANDALTAIALATRAPVLIAPAVQLTAWLSRSEPSDLLTPASVAKSTPTATKLSQKPACSSAQGSTTTTTAQASIQV